SGGRRGTVGDLFVATAGCGGRGGHRVPARPEGSDGGARPGGRGAAGSFPRRGTESSCVIRHRKISFVSVWSARPCGGGSSGCSLTVADAGPLRCRSGLREDVTESRSARTRTHGPCAGRPANPRSLDDPLSVECP